MGIRDRIRNSKREIAGRVLAYGPEGIGKSTWASNAPNPIFIGCEDGLNQLDVPLFRPESFPDVCAFLDDLAGNGHDYQTVIVDTVDWLETLVHSYLKEIHGWDSIEKPGYGKGYAMAAEELRKMITKLDALHNADIAVILLAHSHIKIFSNPVGEDYSRYELKMHRTSAALLKEWVDAVLFLTAYEWVDDNGKAKSDGRRVIYTERQAAWDAKNRFSLPAVLPLDYDDYLAAKKAGSPKPATDLLVEFLELLAQLGEDHPRYTKAKEFASTNKANGRKLAEGLSLLRSVTQ